MESITTELVRNGENNKLKAMKKHLCPETRDLKRINIVIPNRINEGGVQSKNDCWIARALRRCR